MKVRNHWSAADLQPILRKPSKNGKTVPDQVMSIKTILQKYAQGLPLGGSSRVPVYNGEDDDTPEIAAMELTDRMDYIQGVVERAQNAEKKLKRSKEPQSQVPAPKAQQEPLAGEA